MGRLELLSIVVPVFNEEDVLPKFAARARSAFDSLPEPYELLFVDDGSRDSTAEALSALQQEWHNVRIVTLRRNAGHQAALTAGLDRCIGEAVVTMDVDLQDPPEVVAELVAAWTQRAVDVVYAVRLDRTSDTRFKRRTANLYYRTMRRFAGDQVPHDAGDFRLMSREVVTALQHLPERNRVYRLLVPWLGFPSATVSYSRERRAGGTTKYPVSKMLRLAADSITSFTAQPLRIATWCGGLGSLACIIIMIAAVTAQLSGHTVPGWASVFVAVLFVGAIQLLCLGLLGEYVGRLYAEAQRRPLYQVRSDVSTSPEDQHRLKEN